MLEKVSIDTKKTFNHAFQRNKIYIYDFMNKETKGCKGVKLNLKKEETRITGISLEKQKKPRIIPKI